MRIFYASDRTPTGGVTSNIWRENLWGALVDLGHDVVEFDYDLSETFRYLDTENPEHLAFIRQNRPKVAKALLEQIRNAHAHKPLDLVFTYFYDACVEPRTIRAIGELGIPTVNWYCNASYQLHLVREISPAYTACLVPEAYRLEDYRKLGARPIYCQEAANPKFYKNLGLAPTIDVSFIGQAYGERPGLIRRLLDHGIQAQVFGPRWDRYFEGAPTHAAESPWRRRLLKLRSVEGLKSLARNAARRAITSPKSAPEVTVPRTIWGGVLDDAGLVRTFNQTKINLGFAAVGSGETQTRITQVRLRDFEVPICGGFYLTEHVDELGEFFKIGAEIETYRSPEELVSKCEFYLRDEPARDRIRRAGHARSLRDHTWQKRLSDAFAQVALSPR
jgi:spore maturation protein CgeB